MERSRWMSRKFLMSVAAQVAGVLVLLWPEHAGAIEEAVRSVVSLLVIALTGLGYTVVEGSVDRARSGRAG